jgi:hypothetical protein
MEEKELEGRGVNAQRLDRGKSGSQDTLPKWIDCSGK